MKSMKSTDKPIIVEQTYNASVETIWSAITELDEMHKWYFDNIPDFKTEAGFKAQLKIENEGREFTHKWEITRVEENKIIEIEWKFEEYPGRATVSFGLEPLDNKTKLTLTDIVLEDFPDDIPEFQRESCVGGWEYFLNKLKDYLADN